MDNAIVASRKDRLRVRRRRDAQHGFICISDLFLLATTRTLLPRVRFEIGVGGNAAAIRGRDDNFSVAWPGEGRYGG